MPAGLDGPRDERLLPPGSTSPAGSPADATCCSRSSGYPTFRRGDPVGDALSLRNASSLVEEQAAAAYTERALAALQRAGCVGAMLGATPTTRSAIWEEATARPRGRRALVRALASRRLGEAVRRRRGGVRQARGDSQAQTDTRGSIAEREQFLVDPDVELPRSTVSLSHERTGLARGIEVLGLAPRTPQWATGQRRARFPKM